MLKLLTTTAIVAAAMPVAVHAQGQPARMNFDIKAGDTAAALNQFANQAHVHVVFPYDVVANQRVAGVRGSFTRGEALRRLIAGQGLLIASETAGMISLKAAPVAANAPLNMAADDSPQTDIVVLGQGNSRQVQTVAPKAMAKATAGSSPLRS